MEGTPVTFGIRDAMRIDRVVNDYERSVIGRPTPRKQRNPAGGEFAEGTLTSAIVPPDDGRVLPATFTFRQWINGEIGGERDEDTEDITGYSRSSSISGAIGDYVICVRSDNGEWRPIHVDPSC